MAGAKRRRVTLSDVASKARVSISTASVVLSFKDDVVPVAAETKARVLAAAKQLDYEPNAAARALNTQRSSVVGVVGGAASFAEAERMRGIRSFLERRGYSIRVLPHREDGTLADIPLKAYRSQSIDGLIIIGGDRLLPPERLREIVEEGMPIVTADVEARDPRVPSVNVASYDGYCGVIKHLVGHGYQHVALIRGNLEARPARECLRAYMNTLFAAGIPFDERYVIEGDWHTSSGYYCTKELLSRGIPIRAIQTGNDMMAVGAMRAITEQGLQVPEDIAVAGYDDDAPMLATHSAISLTTVSQPFFRLGNEVAALLYDLLNGKQPIWNSVIPVDLALRESCGCKWPDTKDQQCVEDGHQAGQLSLNTPVELKDQVVSAVFGHAFYVQNQEGTGGIGVKWRDTVGPERVVPGDVVSINGRVLTTDGDKMLGDHCVLRTGKIAPPIPRDVSLSALRPDAGGTELRGVLTEVTGTVVALLSDRTRCVTIQDGDGAKASVMLMETDYFPQMRDMVRVIGVATAEFQGIPSIAALRIQEA